MIVYALVLSTNPSYNKFNKTILLEYEAKESIKSFVRVKQQIDSIPIRLSKSEEYHLCVGFECVYMFGRDKDNLLKTWKSITTP